MKPFFDTQLRRASLTRSANEWLGTNFSPHGRIKRLGVDCVHLAAEIYVECGVLQGYRFPEYHLDEGNHAEASKISRWLDNHPAFEQIDTEGEAQRLEPGDLLALRVKKVSFHLGVVVFGCAFIHCLYQRKVAMDQVGAWRSSIEAVYRPVEAAG